MAWLNPAVAPGTLHDQLPQKFVTGFTTLEQNSFVNLIPFDGDMIFHTGLSLTDDLFQLQLEQVNAIEIIKKLNIRRFSFDVGPCYRETQIYEKKYIGIGDRISSKEIIGLCEEKLEWVRRQIPATCKLAVENLNYYDTGAYEEVCEPGFYNEVCKRFGLEIVFDLAHALVSAWNLKVDEKTFLRKFDTAFISELHLSKMAVSGNEAYDAHQAPDEVEFQIIEEMFRKDHIMRDVVIEYWEDATSLIESYGVMGAFFNEKD